MTPDYLQAEERFKSASSDTEKITALEEMLRCIPKHKGTEKMQGDIKRRLSRLRKDSQKKKQAAPQKPFYHIEKEGAGQVLLCGPANSGKSELLSRLTEAQPEIANYPFTTRAPQPGMMAYQDIQIQLVDTPPLAAEILERWQLAMVRQADMVVMLFDVNDPQVLEQTEFVLEITEQRGIMLDERQHPPVIVLGNKTDQEKGRENFSAWHELYQDRLSAQPFSVLSGEDLEGLRQKIFDLLRIVRVYTKAPGKKPEENPTPYVLKRGSTVLDLAATVHKDLSSNFRFARVWGRATFEGQMVERTYVLKDGDLVEIHV